MKSRANNLLERVRADIDGSAKNGFLLNDLLDEFCKGFPTEEVLPLFDSHNADVVRAGAWIVSELGSRACSLFGRIKQHLDSPDPSVRFCMVDCVLLCANTTDIDQLVKVAGLLEDPDASVRWKAIDTLVKLSRQQVSACVEHLKQGTSVRVFVEGFRTLELADSLPDFTKNVLSRANRADSVLNKFLFIAAARIHADREFLEHIASAADDDDLRAFLEDFGDRSIG